MRDLRRKRSTAIIMLLNPLMMLSGAAAAAEPTYIVALGDSITHGEGVSLDEAFPAQLEKMLRADGFNVQVINAGVDGDTTDRMRMRMNTVIAPGTKIVIVQGGRNDFMSLQHSLSVEQSEANITSIVSQLRVQRLRAVLCGGPSRAALARDYGATLVSWWRSSFRRRIAPGCHRAPHHRRPAVACHRGSIDRNLVNPWGDTAAAQRCTAAPA
jgi:hypothetical protein